MVDKLTGETHASFFMADVRRLLTLYVHECPSLHALLKGLPTRNVEVILAEDEATAGNVLNPQQRMKTLLVLHDKAVGPMVRISQGVDASSGNHA